MCIHSPKRAVFVLFIASFFSACGELDMVLPSAGTYQVDALVNETPLNECSLIGKADRIYPYFVNPVTDDPDVTGLLVFLQDSSGQIVGQKIQYTLGGETAEPEQPPPGSGESPEESETDSKPEGETIKASESIHIIEPAEIEESVTLIPVNRLDESLPFFTLPDSLEFGHYTMTFQVLGEKEILYREEKPVYFLEDAEFSLGDIQKYLPDVTTGTHLIPPGLTIMLEAPVVSDERFDPYIIWYSGRKRLSEGRLAGGAGFMLWKAPEQTGFHTIRAEVFPVRPVSNLVGKSREITLPISSKVKNTGYFEPESEHIVYWYQFQGNLQDSKTPVSTERALIPRGEKASRWLPEDNIYGLVTGPKTSYVLSRFSLVPPEEKHNSGRFMFRFKPVSEGLVLSVLFASESAPLDQVYMNLSFSGETLNLDLIGREASASIPLSYTPEEDHGFITLFVDFSLREDRFDARLRMEDGGGLPAEPVSIPLTNSLNGEGSLQLGASLIKPEYKEEQADPVSPEVPAVFPVTAIFDEFALSRLDEPLVPEAIEPETAVLSPEEGEEALPLEESVPPEIPVQEPAARTVITEEEAPPPAEEEPAAEPAAPEEALLLSSDEEKTPEFSPIEENVSSAEEEEVPPEPQDVS